jgi:hypothetical protein
MTDDNASSLTPIASLPCTFDNRLRRGNCGEKVLIMSVVLQPFSLARRNRLCQQTDRRRCHAHARRS